MIDTDKHKASLQEHKNDGMLYTVPFLSLVLCKKLVYCKWVGKLIIIYPNLQETES